MKLGRTGRVEIDAVVHHRVDRPAQCGVPPFARHLGDRAKCVGNDAQYVHTVPGGTLGREVLDDLLRCSAVPRLGTVCCGDRCAQRLGRHAEFPCLGSPPRPQIRDTVACLVPTGIGGGLAANGRSLDARRVAALALPKVDELVGNRLFYLDGPLREPVKERLGNALDLSLAVDDVAERHAEPIREFGPKHALVQSAKGPLVALQQASIEGAPVTVIGLRLAGDHDVRVQLRIIGATRGLPKRGDRQADGLRMKPPTVVTNSRGGAESLDFAHHGFDRYVMALRESIVAGERPPCREGFRCRQGRVKTGDGANDRAVGLHTINQWLSERCPIDWVTAAQQGFEMFGRDIAAQTEGVRLLPHPLPRKLTLGSREVGGVVRRGDRGGSAYNVVTRIITTHSNARALVCPLLSSFESRRSSGDPSALERERELRGSCTRRRTRRRARRWRDGCRRGDDIVRQADLVATGIERASAGATLGVADQPDPSQRAHGACDGVLRKPYLCSQVADRSMSNVLMAACRLGVVQERFEYDPRRRPDGTTKVRSTWQYGDGLPVAHGRVTPHSSCSPSVRWLR